MAVIDQFKVTGRVALVTGSSRGIGRAIALGLAEQGADVAVHCATRTEEAARVAEAARQHGVRAVPFQADLSESGAPRAMFDQVVQRFGGVDILVLNASVELRRPWEKITREEFELQMTVNVAASLELMQLALPGMVARRWGRILTLGSVQQTRPNVAMVAYAATKCAQLSMALSIAGQVAAHGVMINNLAPGSILTDRNAGVLADPAYRARAVSRIPAGRIGETADCIGAALLLCSDAGRYITGVDLFVDGGLHLAHLG